MKLEELPFGFDFGLGFFAHWASGLLCLDASSLGTASATYTKQQANRVVDVVHVVGGVCEESARGFKSWFGAGWSGDVGRRVSGL